MSSGRQRLLVQVLVAGLVVFSTLGIGHSQDGTGAGSDDRALDTLLRVQVKQKFSGIRYEDRLITRSSVMEVSESVGVVVDARGLVVSYIGSSWTNLVGGQALFNVILPDGRSFGAKLVGIDERISVAILQVDELKGRPVVLGALDQGRQAALHGWTKGGWVGYPVRIEQTAGTDVDFEKEVRIRTDLEGGEECCPDAFPIEGSALLDKSSRFLGFVTQADRSGLSRNLRSLRVLSVTTARDSVHQVLKRGGNVQAGWLGIFMKDDTKRVVVEDLVGNSPADKVGIRKGDLILKINGKNIWSRNQFVKLVRWAGPGAKITLSVERDGRLMTFEPVLGGPTEKEQPVFVWAMEIPPVVGSGEQEAETGKVRFYPVLAGAKPSLGLELHLLSPQLVRFFKLPGKSGLLVESVLPGSLGEKLGFRAGDVLIEANGNPLRSVTDLTSLVDATSDETAGLEVVYVREGRVLSRKIVIQ